MGAEVFCWQGASSLLLSWCLLTIPIYHLFNTSVKLANCILQQSSDVPVSPESINCLLLRILPTLHPVLLSINDLSFASWNNEVLWPIMWNYRCSVGALCHPFTFFAEAVDWNGFIFQTLLDFCLFLDGSSTILAGTVSFCFGLIKWLVPNLDETIKSVLTDPFKGSFQLINHEGELDISEHNKLALSIPGDSAVTHFEITFGMPLLGYFHYHRTTIPISLIQGKKSYLVLLSKTKHMVIF